MPSYKFMIDVQYKSSVRDPRGETIKRVLNEEHKIPVRELRIGKSIFVELEAGDRDEAYELVERMCKELLVNPVVETYEVRQL